MQTTTPSAGGISHNGNRPYHRRYPPAERSEREAVRMHRENRAALGLGG